MSSKTENVDVAFQMINEAVEEYENFLLGIPEGNIYQRIMDLKTTGSSNNTADREARKVMSAILDRTNGGLSLNNIGDERSTLFKEPPGTSESVINIVHGDHKFGISQEHYESGPGSGGIYDLYKSWEMSSVLMYVDPLQFKSRTITPKTIPTGSENTTNNPDPRQVTGTELTEGGSNLTQVPPAGLNRVLGTGPGTTGFNKTQDPSFGAVIVRDPVFGFNSRNANHMPVFLGAITPLEMSRCTPYLDIKVITKKRSQDSFSKLGIHNFLRYEKPVRDTEGFSLFEDSVPAGGELKEVIDGHFDFMNVFTSPQTMVNPDINRNKRFSLGAIKDSLKAIKDGDTRRPDYDLETVRDPFQPFMTLLSFNASITGIGHGLLATKKASLKIKLHDKSRMKDLSPLLSPNEFSGTKFIIEHGWSHPDGAVDSSNTIGKYLNALRDLSVYQLVNANYSFGNDNSVDITLNLVCSGFQQLKTISAAGGIYTNLDTVVDEIQEDIEEAFKNSALQAALDITPNNNERGKKIKEIRGQLRINTSDLNSNSTLVKFEDLQKLKEGLEKLAGGDDPSKEEIFDALIRLIYGIDEGDSGTIIEIKNAINKGKDELLNAIKAALDSKKPNAGDIIYAKFRSLPLGIDPFRAQTVRSFYETALGGNTKSKKKVHEVPLIGIGKKYGEKAIDDHVSLGKIISSFVGYPMSTCGLYDEVQLVFYPVNNQSAAARKHTTASFPINLKDLEKELHKRTKAGEQSFRNLSVHAFFAILERIVSKQTATAYDLFPEDEKGNTEFTPLESFRQKTREEKYKEASGADKFNASDIEARTATEAEAAGSAITDAALEDLKKSKVIEAYQEFLAKAVQKFIDERLKEVYNKEEEYFPGYFIDKEKFSLVNLSMFFETFSPKNKNKGGTESALEKFLDIVGAFEPGKRRNTVDNGKDVTKTILRIHIYDENSNMGPDVSLYGANAVNMSKTAKANESNLGNRAFIKSLMMKRQPTIIHGASSGVVNSIKVSSNTSGQLSNILMVEAYGQSLNASVDTGGEPESFDEVVMLPTTIDLEMMGFPMLARGQQIFIDFGTQTSLDNLYTVKSVDHEIQAGSYKTSAILVAANQMILSSFRNRLQSLIKETGKEPSSS
jgi:hypothetical protein